MSQDLKVIKQYISNRNPNSKKIVAQEGMLDRASALWGLYKSLNKSKSAAKANDYKKFESIMEKPVIAFLESQNIRASKDAVKDTLEKLFDKVKSEG
jgi:hypothetical protein